MNAPKVDKETVFGLTVDRWFQVTQTFGVPTLFMFFVCYLVWTYIPPVVDGHIKLLEQNIETNRETTIALEEIHATDEENIEINKQASETLLKIQQRTEEQMPVLEAILQGDYPSMEWRDKVNKEHKSTEDKVDQIQSTLDDMNKRIP